MKTHISLNVSDIEASRKFYERMLGTSPVKVKEDYVKFDVANPPLNLTLNKGTVVKGGQLSHLGIQVRNTEDVKTVAERWEKEGLLTLEEMGTDCCYALQDKVWVEDPDGAHWEIFTVLGDTEGTEKKAEGCCNPVETPLGISETKAACC